MALPVDFGCHTGSVVEALPGAELVIVLFILLAGMGGVIGGSRRWPAADLISGWGFVVFIFTLGGVLLQGAMPYCAGIAAAACVAAMASYVYKRKRAPWHAWFLLALALQIWILTLINHAGIAGWDDIAQWTPNALFLWRHEGFPNLDLPLPYSNRPGYPYALAYLNYIVSLAHGAFVIQAGAMINWLLLTSFAWALTEFEAVKRTVPRKLMRFGIALLLVTLFDPAFNASFSITNQSDVTTSAVTGFLGLLLIKLYDALRKKDRRQIKALAWQTGAALLVLTLLRDMNIILAVLFIVGFLMLAAREKIFQPAVLALAPGFFVALIFFALWRTYTQHAMFHDGAASVMPLAAWRWAMLPQLLRAAGMEMLKKNGLFGMMFIASGFGIRALWHGKARDAGALAVLTAVVFLGYIGFILVAFIGSAFFTEHNVANAMSFYRYGTHTGLLGIALVWFMFERYGEPKLKPKTIVPIVVLTLGLLPLAYIVKPGWLVPQPGPALCAARALGDTIARGLPPQSRLAILDFQSNGFGPFIINLELALDDIQSQHQSRVVAYANPFEPDKLSAMLAELREGGNIDAAYVVQPPKEIGKFFNMSDADARGLFVRQGKNWQAITLPVSGSQ